MANHAQQIRNENAGLTVTRRGRRFVEFDLGGGRKRYVATIDPLHLRADLQTEIDATWVADTGAWQWKIAATDYQFHARDIFNAGSLVEWRHSSGEWIIVDPQSINWINQDNSRQQIAIKQAVTGQASDATLTFPNGYGTGRHFEYIAHPRRMIKHVIIDSAANLPAPTVTGTIQFEVEFTITNSSGVELYLDGVRWARSNNVRVRTSNQIEFRNLTTGEVLWYADAPVATDANGDIALAQYEVRRTGGTYFITVRVPKTWIDTAAYPIKVDPTFTDGYGGDATTAKDTILYEAVPDNNYGAGTNLYVHEAAGERIRILIDYDLSSLSGYTITSATHYLYSGATTTIGVTHHKHTQIWVEGTYDGGTLVGATCWAYRIYNSARWAGDTGSDGGTDAGCSVSGTDYEATSLGTIHLDSPSAGTEGSVELTSSEVQEQFGGTLAMVLVPDAGNTNWGYFCSSDHATTGYRPKLVVEYTAESSTDLVVSDATHAHTADNLFLATDATNLVVVDSTHAHTADNIVLAVGHHLVVADSTHAHAVDTLNLRQILTLAIEDSTHAHSADALSLTQIHILVASDSTHAHVADALALTQTHVLATSDSAHSHLADAPVLTQTHRIVIADSTHALSSDNVTLTTEGTNNLVTSDSIHSHSADAITLTQIHVLSIADSTHAHTADNVTLQTSGINNLVIADALHAHTADALTLTQIHVLGISGATNNHLADSVVLATSGINNLVISDAIHSHAADVLALSQVHIISVSDSTHSHASDNATLVTEGTNNLVIADALHSHFADSFALTQNHVVAISGAIHAHYAESVSLSAFAYLYSNDTLHSLLSDSISLSQIHILSISDSTHSLTSDNVIIPATVVIANVSVSDYTLYSMTLDNSALYLTSLADAQVTQATLEEL